MASETTTETGSFTGRYIMPKWFNADDAKVVARQARELADAADAAGKTAKGGGDADEETRDALNTKVQTLCDTLRFVYNKDLGARDGKAEKAQ